MRVLICPIGKREDAIRTGVSIAATNFCHNLMEGALFDCAVGILPPFVRNSKCDSTDSMDCVIDFEIKNSWLRRSPFRIFAPIVEQIQTAVQIKRGDRVWLYNCTPLNGILVKILNWLKPSVKVFIIVLDFTPGDKKAERWLNTINNCDGRIMLSVSDLFNHENSKCLPGVTPNDKIVYPVVNNLKSEFLISGALGDEISLLSRLLPAFAAMPQVTLHICGDAPVKAKEFAAKCPNIICHGKVSFERFNEILDSVPFLLSTRDPGMPENMCNFPSKIIEGLLHNRIIVSTIDYPQLGDIKYLKIDSDRLESDLRAIMAMPQEELLTYANQSEVTRRAFNTGVWNEAMSQIERNAGL